MKFIGFYNYTVVLTYLSLISGIVGMKFASEGRGELAIICLILSGVCDMFDGKVARMCKRTKEEKEFGILKQEGYSYERRKDIFFKQRTKNEYNFRY